MNASLKRFAEQLLFASNIVIAFLLLFEDKLVVPVWLQPLGRMHPLILHFPIVMLLIAMLMEFFRFRSENQENPYYRSFLQNLLLTGALFAGLTVILGLFLSREDGYTGSTLLWHKWTGAFIFFFSSLIYFVRDSRWYKPVWAKSCTLVVTVTLVLTGHYGAALTHGDDFILAPLAKNTEKQNVPVEQALVFNDVIKPILDQKCASCHNAEKLKGELKLTDEASLLKGGKSGKLFIPGNSRISLLLERVHMPLDEKKHMPPSGKPQLTPDEVALITLWIDREADFSKKVTDFPANDSLRVLATARLMPKVNQEDVFDFPPADEKTITKLNTNYRTVSMLATESPALSVNIYNRTAYTASQLEELSEVKKQIVSLHLNKLPVKDSDLRTVGTFENLRKLDLNFTDITTSGLKELTKLAHLQSLTLTGTKIKFEELKTLLPSFKNLRTITVWETALSLSEIDQLQKANKILTVIGGFRDDGKNPLKLNVPQVKNSSMVFQHELPLLLRHPIKNVQIRFTTDGTEPDSIKSPVFNDKTTLTQNTVIKAKAYKTGWFGSDVVTFDFFRSAFSPDSVTILFPLNRVHQAESDKTFFNHKLGVIGANNPAWANSWAGAKDNALGIMAEFKKPVLVSSFGLHYMIEEDTGIFPPEQVEVWGGNDPHKLKLLTKFTATLPAKGDKPKLAFASGSFKPQTVSYLKIVAKPLSKIPAWHRDKGNKALLLVDEMFVN